MFKSSSKCIYDCAALVTDIFDMKIIFAGMSSFFLNVTTRPSNLYEMYISKRKSLLIKKSVGQLIEI